MRKRQLHQIVPRQSATTNDTTDKPTPIGTDIVSMPNVLRAITEIGQCTNYSGGKYFT